MIDIHSHILYGLDDGAQSLEESLEMALMASEDGISKIVATPHLFRGNFNCNDLKTLEERRAELENILKEKEIQLELFIGAEVHISHNLIDEIRKNKERLVINKSQYLLVEFPTSHIFSGIKELIFEIMSEGIVPIIAHPERNHVFMDNPSSLYELLEMGVLTQANSGSFLGYYGRRAEITVYRFLEWNFIHFIGTDAHNSRSMAPVLSKSLARVEERMNDNKLRALVLDNPQAVLDGKDIVYRPEPIDTRKNKKTLKINVRFFKRG